MPPTVQITGTHGYPRVWPTAGRYPRVWARSEVATRYPSIFAPTGKGPRVTRNHGYFTCGYGLPAGFTPTRGHV